MDTKDTGIKQEPTAPGAEGNDGGFPQNNPAECGICFTQFDDTERRPRTLPCGHTFCTECIKVSEIIKTLNPESTITFLEMAWKGLTRGRVYIRVSEDTTEDKQFVGLCTGQPGSSFLNTRANIGQVESGLEVLEAAAQLNDITQVTVVDCGVVVPL
ncbi:hypothetical protein Pcinc_008541 [Petrolisthes cinctipes]|uniref:RING-type domain-containing protein n=1 Tax=Petrolisthes cinctipes TaxID=88211 RepID=A0AAE1G5B5_PETCI|nr:hypothetical protein Pcinc_016644 [Petrolisthes cinctipes]KAK3883488.1 hypothetical protein Pcinc_012187 [Petrolisthes cinctipes]KAK3887348.1 hypothetical protein Pcinc_008541 [Petrolisthes cinctipes]